MASSYTPLNFAPQPISKPVEAEPVNVSPELQIKEVIEHEPQSEVTSYIQSRQEVIKVPQEFKEQIVAQPTTQFPSHHVLELPLSDEKIKQGLHASITSSFRWLAELCKYLLKQAHLTLKQVHGKIMRVTTN